MSLSTAQSFALNLSHTLMTQTVVIETDHGYAAMPSGDYDGDPDRVMHEYDPFSA
tara:strand:- start:1042 stop:1206 length:165 start_codon:yes stop_codon:yes gene_type:complete